MRVCDDQLVSLPNEWIFRVQRKNRDRMRNPNKNIFVFTAYDVKWTQIKIESIRPTQNRAQTKFMQEQKKERKEIEKTKEEKPAEDRSESH